MRGEHVDVCVAAELLAGRAGELERDHRLRDDRERLDGGDVAPLDERLRRLVGRLFRSKIDAVDTKAVIFMIKVEIIDPSGASTR